MKLTALPWPVELAVRCCACLLVPVLVIGLSVSVIAAATELPDNAAFRVGDHVVTEQEFDKRTDALRALYGVVPPKGDTKLDSFRRAVAQSIVVSTVLQDAAAEKHIVVPEQTVRADLAKLIQQDSPGGPDEFADFLGKVGASEDEVLDAIRLQRTVGLLFQNVASTSPDTVTDDEVRRYYDQNKSVQVQPETRRIRNIVVATESDAHEVSEQARAGADFASLAKQYSLDQSTSQSGGDLGFLAREQLAAPYAGPAFAAQPGTVFGPVKMPSGWDVGQVVEVRLAEQLRFEQIREQLRTELARKLAMEKWHSWVEQRVRSADVQYADKYRPSGDPQPTDLAPGGTPPVVPSPDGSPSDLVGHP